jgi:3-hydroxyacyl-[acyl-carrier-protein] dehydratase
VEKIESAGFFKGVEYDKIFKVVVKNIKLTDRLIKQSGIGYVDDIPCVELTWTCVKLRA